MLSLLDLKDAFHSLKLLENSKRYCRILPYLKISSMWQSYINAILDCLQSRKYCEAIMDDLLLFTQRNCI